MGGFRAKKSMGQNFLKSQEAVSAMCKASDVSKDDLILEIGPGKGALTERLLETAGKVIAVEKDFELIRILEEKFANDIESGHLALVHEDILAFNPNDYNLPEGKYKIIANIPYNITGAIIKKFLSESNQPSQMTLLVQKEVAMRIVSRDNKESVLSLSVKAYGEPKYIMKVSKRFFSPEPKVDSAIISIRNISRINFNNRKSESLFFNIIKTGFAHKRKFLKSNLAGADLKTGDLDKIFQDLNLDPKTRAENVPLSVWLKIARLN